MTYQCYTNSVGVAGYTSDLNNMRGLNFGRRWLSYFAENQSGVKEPLSMEAESGNYHNR